MLYPNVFERMISNEILDYASEQGVVLTNEELKYATNGVKHCISQCISDSIKDAFSDVMYDREKDLRK